MGSVASKDGKGAVELPWRAFKSPREQAKVLPTFLACESIFGVLAAASLAHAKRTGNVQLWFYGWMCGTANDALFMLLPFVDNFWHAQACVMLTPRLPLYIPGVYAVFTYASIAAARKFNLPYLQEAALAGLLSHLLYHAYDVNGPRFLWWTWHDGDPSVSARQENAPIGSSTWVLTYCAAHAVLSRWVNDAGASLERSVAVWLGQRSGVLVEKLNTVLRALDRMHSVIVSSPSLIKIAFCGLAGTPLFMALMGVFQVISFDKLGIPGQRTYRAILLAYSLAVAGPSFAQNGSAIPTVPAPNRSSADRVYFRALAVYFVVQAAIGILGKPRSHVSTGCHQQCSDGHEKGKDIMGWERLEYMRSGGPFEHSRDDYEVLPRQLDGRLDAAGRPMITPIPDTSLPEHVWYTVVGTKHKNRTREVGRAVVYCVCGLLAYQRAFASSGGRGNGGN